MALRSVNQLDSATDLTIPLDVRGWDVRTSIDEENVGSVHDVLVDESGTARYLDVDLGIFSKHVLLPVGQASTDERRDVIWVGGMNKDDFEDIPAYDHGADRVSAEFEQHTTRGYDERMRTRRHHRPEYGGSMAPVGAGVSTRRDSTALGTENVRLQRLSDLDDYEVADHDPDPRGWSLVSRTGDEIGAVEDLVVDPQAMKARYLEVELKGDAVRDRDADHALIPVGYARLDADRRSVRVDALDRGDISTLPRFNDRFDDDYEDRIDHHFSARFEGDARYRHPRYDSARLFASRAAPGSTTAEGRYGDVNLRR